MAPDRRSFLLGSAASLWVASFSEPSKADDALTPVRFGSIGGLSDAGLYVAQDLGFFKEQGLALQPNRMADGAALTTSLATNQLDVAGISVTPAMFAAVAQGLNIKIVGDKQSYKQGVSATQFVVRAPLAKADKSATIQGLNGKTIGVSSQKSVAFMQVENLLQMYGVDPTKARYVNLQYPEMAVALKTGAIDAAQIIEPFLTESLDSKSAVIVSDMIEARGAIGTNTTVPLVYSEKFAENHKVGLAFMVAYMKGVRAYIDALEKGINKGQIYGILAKNSKMPTSLIDHVHLPYLDPNQKIEPTAFEEMQKYFLQKGWLRERADISKLVDTSFAEEAAKKLGPYA